MVTKFFQSVTTTTTRLFATVYAWPVAAQVGMLIFAFVLAAVLRRVSIASNHELFSIVCALAAGICLLALFLVLACLGTAAFHQLVDSLPYNLSKLPFKTPITSG